jgi:hypothetical protein
MSTHFETSGAAAWESATFSANSALVRFALEGLHHVGNFLSAQQTVSSDEGAR